MNEKEGEKHQQHEQLEQLLRQGNPGSTVSRHTLILGRTGAIPTSLFTLLGSTLTTLSKSEIQRVGRKLSRHAVQYIEKFVWARRAAAAQSAGEGGGLAAGQEAALPRDPSQFKTQQQPHQGRPRKRQDPP